MSLLGFWHNPLNFVVAVKSNLEQEQRWLFDIMDSAGALAKFSEIYNQGHCNRMLLEYLPGAVEFQVVEFLKQHPNPSITGLCCICPLGVHNLSDLSGRLIGHYSSTLTDLVICTCGGAKDCWKSIKLCDKLEVLSTICISNQIVPQTAIYPRTEKATQKYVLEALNNKSLRGFFIGDITIKSSLELCRRNSSTLTRLGFDGFGGGAISHYCRPFEVSCSDAFWRCPKLLPTLPLTLVDRIGSIHGLAIGIKWLSLVYSFSEFQERLMPKYRERVATIPKLFPNLTHFKLWTDDEAAVDGMDEQAAKMLIEAFLNISSDEERLIRVYLWIPETELPWKMMEEGKCRKIEKERTDHPSYEHCTRIIKGNITVLLRVDGVVEVGKGFHCGRFSFDN